MIRAWLIYYDLDDSHYHIEERDGTDAYDSLDAGSWGLHPDRHTVIAAFQQASFLNVWIEGKKRERY